MPKLSVLMPVYNGERFLREAIKSVLNQTFTDYEFLIIDDKSQDNSRDIISSYRDRRIHFVQNKENLGQMKTLNVGIEHCCGQYIARMDQDDTSLPERFEKEVEILDKLSDIGLVYSNSFIINEKGVRRERTFFDYAKPQRSFVFEKLLERNFIIGNTVMVRKTIFKDVGVFNPVYQLAAEYDFFLRVARKYKVDFIDESLAEYRTHGGNSSADIEKGTKEIIRIFSSLISANLESKQRTILNRMFSWHTASLGMCYLFQNNRQMSKAKAMEALRIAPFNLKAFATIFMAIFFPDSVIDYVGSFRKGWLE